MNHCSAIWMAGLMLVISGCQTDHSAIKTTKPEIARSGDASPVRIVDGVGRTVSLSSPATRIVSLSPGFTETLFAIGCGGQIVVRDRWSDYPAEAKSLPITDSVNPSMDAIGGFDPDLVLLYFSDARHVNALDRIGVPSAVFDPKTIAEVAGDVEKLGILCGKPDMAKKLSAQLMSRRKRIAKASGKLPRVRVYVEVDGTDSSRPWTAGRQSFVNELLVDAGAVNVFADMDNAYGQVNLEEVIARNPDVILLAGTEDARTDDVSFILRRPGFQEMSAVRHGRIIHTIDKNLLSRTSPRLLDGLEQLFTALHPQESGI